MLNFFSYSHSSLLDVLSSLSSSDAQIALAAHLLTRNHRATSKSLRALRPVSVHRMSYYRRCGKCLTPDVLKIWHCSEHLTLHHARALCRIPRMEQKEIADRASKYRWSVAKINRYLTEGNEANTDDALDCHFEQYVTALSEASGIPTTIEYKDGVGFLHLQFFGFEDLDNIAAKLGYVPKEFD